IGIALHPTNPSFAFGGSQDNGTVKSSASLSWNKVHGADGGFIRVDFYDPQIVYQETQRMGANRTAGSGFLSRSDNDGISWMSKTSGIDPSDLSNFYIPYVMDPSNPSRLLLGTNRVYETTDQADNWTPISTPDANGWVGNGVIDSLAVAASDGNTIYAAA